MSTDPGDLVLDSFLGSGTTAAVAHKMKRRFIGIEMGDHAYTLCKPRLDNVIAGNDSLGITKASVLGVSQGGMIAQYIAINHPEIMDKLILAVTTPYANNVVKTAVSGWIEMAKNGDHVTLMVDTAEKMYSEQYMKKNKKKFPLMARFIKPKTYERFFKNAYAILDFDARNELSKIQCPTFIVSGSDDKTVGNDAPKEFSQSISDAKVYIYEGLGHGTFTEAKDFYDRILAFLKK